MGKLQESLLPTAASFPMSTSPALACASVVGQYPPVSFIEKKKNVIIVITLSLLSNPLMYCFYHRSGCKNSMNHLGEGACHEAKHRCRYSVQYDNRIYTCKVSAVLLGWN